MLVAIDPGMSKSTPGGIAWFQGNDKIDCCKMPSTPMDIFQQLDRLSFAPNKSLLCIMEKVGFYRPGNSATSAVKFARHCGHLDMALLALHYQIEMVAPSKWMRGFLGTVPKDKRERKNAIKIKCQQRLPYLGRKITLATSDALGILLWQMEHRNKGTQEHA